MVLEINYDESTSNNKIAMINKQTKSWKVTETHIQPGNREGRAASGSAANERASKQ